MEGNELYNDPSFKGHAKSAATAIGDAITILRDLYTLVPILNHLGEKHVERGVLPEHYLIFGEALIKTLKSGLKDKITSNVEESWNEIYKVISGHMQYEWYTNPDLIGNELTKKRI